MFLDPSAPGTFIFKKKPKGTKEQSDLVHIQPGMIRADPKCGQPEQTQIERTATLLAA